MERLQPVWEAIRRFWKNRHITQILLLAVLLLILLTILYFAFLASQANVETLKVGLTQKTVIYDKDADKATNISTNRTEGVKINALPDYIPNAVVAIEDERFYKHNGFDIKGIARAFFGNLFSGRITGGGSTITQQLTKNALLSPEQTYKRKAEELFLAVEIEKHYKKDEILQMYLNQVYFGSGAWGISQAAVKYFNKPIEDITVSEAAMLAGLLQSPSALDPYRHYERAVERRNVVLAKMKEENLISNSEYKAAKKEEIKLEDGGGSAIERKYPYYTDAVLDEAINQYGLTQEEILTRGYKIYTELDQNLQSVLENVYENNSLFPRGRDVLIQSGAVLLDPGSGGVRGLVGGRGEYVFRGFNRATHLKAQPGSTMKPLSVYTPALEEGYKVTSMLKDEPISFGDYKPENASRTYRGKVPMYEAVEESINVPAVWLLDQIGLEKGIDSLKRFGIPLEKEDRYLGIALGGMRKGVSPLQLAEAFSTFPNDGKRRDGHLITKIVGPTGNVIAEHRQKTTKVTTKKVANNMTSMLLNVVETGTGKATNIPGIQIAGKTGTTQLPYNDINGSKDQWFVGYTPNLVGAVWLGYDNTDRRHYLSSSSSENAVPIFRAIIEGSKEYISKGSFDAKSVNQQKESDVATNNLTKDEIREKTKKIEDELLVQSSKWKRVLEEGRKELEVVGRKVIDKVRTMMNE